MTVVSSGTRGRYNLETYQASMSGFSSGWWSIQSMRWWANPGASSTMGRSCLMP